MTTWKVLYHTYETRAKVGFHLESKMFSFVHQIVMT